MRRRPYALLALACVLGACDGEIRLLEDQADSSNQSDGVVLDGSGDGGGCAKDSDCVLSSLHCYLPARICVPCLSDDHCKSGEGTRRCDTATHRCVECGVPSDCDGDETCEPTTHRCVHKCGDGGSCPSETPKCGPSGWCVGCTSDPDCKISDRPVCEKASGRCVQCVSDAQCTSSEERRCDMTLGRCVRCLTSSDCPVDKPYCDPYKRECVDGK